MAGIAPVGLPLGVKMSDSAFDLPCDELRLSASTEHARQGVSGDAPAPAVSVDQLRQARRHLLDADFALECVERLVND